MNKLTVLPLVALLSFPVATVQAVDAHDPDKSSSGLHASTGSEQQMGDGMMMGKMQAYMKQMMQQMDEIHQTKDAEKKNQLMREHMQSMHKGMDMMRNMGGDMMKDTMGGGDGKGMMGGKGMMEERHQMMEQRMDMMQMMMEQMMEQMMERQGTQSAPRHDHRKQMK